MRRPGRDGACSAPGTPRRTPSTSGGATGRTPWPVVPFALTHLEKLMLAQSLVVNSYVVIQQGCPLAVAAEGPDHVQIVCGWPPHNAFELVVEHQALRGLVEITTEALAQLDTAQPARRFLPTT